MPRRVVNGVDSSRVAMLLAVLERRSNMQLSAFDVYVSTVGGIRVTEPGADLAIALAIASAFKGKALPATTAAIGEISLAGEIGRASSAKQRVAEAKRLGFSTVLDAQAEHLHEALKLAFVGRRPTPRMFPTSEQKHLLTSRAITNTVLARRIGSRSLPLSPPLQGGATRTLTATHNTGGSLGCVLAFGGLLVATNSGGRECPSVAIDCNGNPGE